MVDDAFFVSYNSPSNEMRCCVRLAKIFKALSDPSRVRALCALQDNELCVCQIVELLGLAASTVSKHMSILANAELVESTKKGRWVYYRQGQVGVTQLGLVLGVLPQLADKETQVQQDRETLKEILKLDPETLCRLQSERQ